MAFSLLVTVTLMLSAVVYSEARTGQFKLYRSGQLNVHWSFSTMVSAESCKSLSIFVRR